MPFQQLAVCNFAVVKFMAVKNQAYEVKRNAQKYNPLIKRVLI